MPSKDWFRDEGRQKRPAKKIPNVEPAPSRARERIVSGFTGSEPQIRRKPKETSPEVMQPSQRTIERYMRKS